MLFIKFILPSTSLQTLMSVQSEMEVVNNTVSTLTHRSCVAVNQDIVSMLIEEHAVVGLFATVLYEVLILCVNAEVDECSEDLDNCEHECTNTDGSFTCSCHTGYQLNSDGHSCSGLLTCIKLPYTVLLQMLLQMEHYYWHFFSRY